MAKIGFRNKFGQKKNWISFQGQRDRGRVTNKQIISPGPEKDTAFANKKSIDFFSVFFSFEFVGSYIFGLVSERKKDITSGLTDSK